MPLDPKELPAHELDAIATLAARVKAVAPLVAEHRKALEARGVDAREALELTWRFEERLLGPAMIAARFHLGE